MALKTKMKSAGIVDGYTYGSLHKHVTRGTTFEIQSDLFDQSVYLAKARVTSGDVIYKNQVLLHENRSNGSFLRIDILKKIGGRYPFRCRHAFLTSFLRPFWAEPSLESLGQESSVEDDTQHRSETE